MSGFEKKQNKTKQNKKKNIEKVFCRLVLRSSFVNFFITKSYQGFYVACNKS